MDTHIAELYHALINWHQLRYPNIDNQPNKNSASALVQLCEKVLLPIERHFGKIDISYGFTSPPLLTQIKKHNPCHIAPNLDQNNFLLN